VSLVDGETGEFALAVDGQEEVPQRGETARLWRDVEEPGAWVARREVRIDAATIRGRRLAIETIGSDAGIPQGRYLVVLSSGSATQRRATALLPSATAAAI
jgi:hypothetical protein